MKYLYYYSTNYCRYVYWPFLDLKPMIQNWHFWKIATNENKTQVFGKLGKAACLGQNSGVVKESIKMSSVEVGGRGEGGKK